MTLTANYTVEVVHNPTGHGGEASFGTATVSEEVFSGKGGGRCFDLRPGAIIKNLNLRRSIYRQIAAYGHFGRDDLDLPWETTDLVKPMKRTVQDLLKRGAAKYVAVTGSGSSIGALVDTVACTIDAPGKLVAAVGLEDLVIVDTPDALLVCRKDRVQEIKRVISKLKEQGKVEYL